MKLAIKTSIGQIVNIDKPLSELRFYVKVNPLANVVKKTKKGWVPVYPEGIQFLRDE